MDLHEAQKRFLNDTALRTFMLGGRQSGKTTAGVHAGVTEMARGKSVTLLAPKLMMAEEATRTAVEIVQDYGGSLKKHTRARLELDSGGSMSFESGSSDHLFLGRDDEILIVDEICKMDLNTIDMITRHSVDRGVPVIAMGTPERGFDTVDVLRSKGYSVTPVFTTQNPRSDISAMHNIFTSYEKGSPERMLGHGRKFGEHLIAHYMDGSLNHMKCLMCDMEYELPTEIAPEAQSRAMEYVHGEAYSTSCA